jgi:hypothetical protein
MAIGASTSTLSAGDAGTSANYLPGTFWLFPLPKITSHYKELSFSWIVSKEIGGVLWPII